MSGEISQYLNSLEDAWRLYLNDVTVKLEEEMTSIRELESAFSALIEEESEIQDKVNAGRH